MSVNSRLEAFCDGVFAIALTLLIIDIKLPAMDTLRTSDDVWHGLRLLAPSVFAFLLSFGIIFITWVNHHNALKMIVRSSAPFIYANGALLLMVVFIPFPTSLLGASILTDHAAPGVALYNAVLAALAVGWLLIGEAALRGDLIASARLRTVIKGHRTQAYGAIVLYSLLAIAAWWLPKTVAVMTTATWTFWLVLSLRSKHEDA